MIEELTVNNYVLFDREHVNFENQMTAITGETGAGKSLLIDAISLLTGARAAGSVVRPEAEKAVLQMVVSDLSDDIVHDLKEAGYEIEDELIIRRTLFPNGKSRMQINDQSATNAFVRELSSRFLDIHSQMDSIKLSDPAIQLSVLDSYAGNDQLKEEVAKAYIELKEAQNELEKLQKETFSDEELEFLTAQLNEINEADVKEGEYETLKEQIKEASRFSRSSEDIQSMLHKLKGDSLILDQMDQIRKAMKSNTLFAEEYDRFLESYHALVDLSDALQEKYDLLSQQAFELDQMQEREYLLQRLFRKYGGSYPGLMEHKSAIEDKINRILHRQDVFERLQKEIQEKMKAYDQKAEELSGKRAALIPKLEQEIIRQAKDLMLEQIRFNISQKPKERSRDGIDSIEFMASMNPGIDLAPLKQAGSGGEISRLMLALKTVFQAEKGITTLIFDEIDTGVSGKVAFAMGSKMSSLAENYQVLSITHLPAVAAWADHHLRVSKKLQNDKTITYVESLEDDQKIEELALMSSGTSEKAQKESAAQLLERVRKLKEKVHA